MFVTHIKLTNFKSFKEIDVSLSNFNVVIAPHNAGKSNFVKAFKFIKNIQSVGIENAISLLGGKEYFRNINLPAESKSNLSVQFLPGYKSKMKDKNIQTQLYEANYNLSIEFTKSEEQQNEPGFKIVEDKLLHQFKFLEIKGDKLVELPGNVGVEYFIDKNKLENKIYENLPALEGHELFKIFMVELFQISSFIEDIKFPANSLTIQSPILRFAFGKKDFESISVYNIDSKLAKQGLKQGKVQLDENGSNLALVLEKILINEPKKQKFIELISKILPYAEHFTHKREFDGSLIFNLKEKYNQYDVPSFLLSDSTINLIAIIVGTFFEDNSMVVFKEPCACLNPYSIHKVVDLMKIASATKQILMTTHNLEVLKYVDINDVIVITRDAEGYSSLIRPKTIEEAEKIIKSTV